MSPRRPRVKVKARNRHAKFLRDLKSAGAYEQLLELQAGACGICGRAAPDDRRLDMDHDHGTMTLRGLCCRGCNMRLRRGMTPAWLRAAADYLENPPAGRLPR